MRHPLQLEVSAADSLRQQPVYADGVFHARNTAIVTALVLWKVVVWSESVSISGSSVARRYSTSSALEPWNVHCGRYKSTPLRRAAILPIACVGPATIKTG